MFSINEEKEIKITIEKSKFYGLCFFCNNIERQNEILKQVRRNNLNATHVCYGSFFYDNNQELCYSSDDGEPSGTAGLQIANALKENKVVNALIVVVRYFGGIKLGVGGLTRAYKDTANKTLENNLKQVYLRSKCKITCSYSVFDYIKKFLDANNITCDSLEFEDEVVFKCYLKEEEMEYLTNKGANTTEENSSKIYC